MKKMYRTLAVSALLGGLALTTYAQEFKAGFVNTDRIFREASSAKAAQSKLEQEFSKRERELIAASNQLKSASEAFERDAPTMSESQRLAKQRALVEQDRDFQRKSREFQEDLSVRKNRVVQQVAEKEKYDIILQEAVYVNPKHDITDKVIKALNDGSK